jgi:hypothetical protein
MSNSFGSFCDDFYLDMHINTELDLPTGRDTILAFFEQIQKHFPSMGTFYRRDNTEYCLEEDHNQNQYRWVTLETDRIGSGVDNPTSFEDAYAQDKIVIELMPYMLGVSHLDINSLDVSFGMDFEYAGNHDEVIAEALGSSTFNSLSDLPAARIINFSPTIITSLSEDCRTQARVTVESKTSIFEPWKKQEATDEAISLMFTIRQYPPGTEKFDSLKSFERQCRLAEELMVERIIPNFARPLSSVILQKRMST